MTKDDIITLPHDSLRDRSKRIGVVSEDTIELIKNMESATLDWEASRKHEVGVALAAVQINDLRRVVIIRNDFDNKEDQTFTAFINPEITKYEGKIVRDYEGCLSVKDVYGKVPRSDKVRVKALNMKGQPIRFTAEGFLARILQHEIDHTNGILFIDHIKDAKDAFYMLTDSGDLEKLDDEAVRSNSLLW